MINFFKSACNLNCVAFAKISSKIWKNFNHRQYGLTQIVHLEEIDQFLHVSICTFYFDKILSRIRSSVWNIIWTTLSFQGFSITFLQKLFCFFFIFFINLINFIHGQYCLAHIFFITIWSFFITSTCGLIGSFFYFEIFLTNVNHWQYRLTQSLHFNQFLSKTNMVRFALYLQKVSVNFYQDTILNTIVNKVPWKVLSFLPDRLLINFYHGTIWFDPYCPFI